MMLACLGGWCRIRERCANYHAVDRREPAERLCPKGCDGASSDESSVRVHRIAGEWERINEPRMLRAAGPFDALQALLS